MDLRRALQLNRGILLPLGVLLPLYSYGVRSTQAHVLGLHDKQVTNEAQPAVFQSIYSVLRIRTSAICFRTWSSPPDILR